MEAPPFHVSADPKEAEFLMETKTAVNQLSMYRRTRVCSETVESQNQDVSCIVPPVLVSKLTKHATQIFEAQYGEPLRKQAEKNESQLRNPLGASMPRSRMHTCRGKMGNTL